MNNEQEINPEMKIINQTILIIIITNIFICSLQAMGFENEDISFFLNDSLMSESFYSLENITSPFNDVYTDNFAPLFDQNDIFDFSISSYWDRTSPIPTQTESFPSNSSPSTELTNTEKLAVKLVNDHINEHKINQLNKSYIKKRIINPSSVKKKTYICEACGYRTKEKRYLIYHNRSKKHQNNTGQQFKSWDQHKHKCSDCKYGTDIKSSYDRHEKAKEHLIKTGQPMLSWEQYKYLCHTCKYGTNIKSSYDQHEKSKEHLIKTIQPLLSWEKCKYLCHTCKYGTDWMGNFNKHQATKKHKLNKKSFADTEKA